MENKMLKESRVRKGLLTLLAAFLTFVGPTYLVLVLQKRAVPIHYCMLLGVIFFIAGVVLFTRVFKEQKT